MSKVAILLIVLALPQTALGTTTAMNQAREVMNAQRFEAEFRERVQVGETMHATEHHLKKWSVSFQVVGRHEFMRNSPTAEAAAPKGAESAIIGTTSALGHTGMFETFAQVLIYFDRDSRVISAHCKILTAGP